MPVYNSIKRQTQSSFQKFGAAPSCVGVGLYAASPHSFLVAGFPLLSLSRNPGLKEGFALSEAFLANPEQLVYDSLSKKKKKMKYADGTIGSVKYIFTWPVSSTTGLDNDFF